MSELSNTTTGCQSEPWGRYSASGGLYPVNDTQYIYSFGGDTQSNADGRGGVVRTNFRFHLDTGCWENLANSPTEIGYRATATTLSSSEDSVYVLFGSDRNRRATNNLYRYSLLDDAWTLLNTTNVPAPRWKHAAVPLDDTRILVTGGRQGQTVHADAWILETATLVWTPLNPTNLPAMYRHGLGFDATRNVTWIYGGLDETLSRYQSQLWQWNMTSGQVVEMNVSGTPPPRLASHAMEYVPQLDVLFLWGGTCSDDSELHIYDIQENSWCRIFPEFAPNRRDAMIWSLQYPHFYVSTGDLICYNQQVLTIADVHVLDLQSLDWEMLYEPTNTPRGTGLEPVCDGTNAGNCQPSPLVEDNVLAQNSTCSADLLERFFQKEDNATAPNSTEPEVSTSKNSQDEGGTKPPTVFESSGGQASQAYLPGLQLAWILLLLVVKKCG